MMDQYRLQRRAAKYLNPYQFFGWSLGLALPWALGMSAFIDWHNGVVGQVQPWHLVLRLAIGWVGFLPILVTVYFKAIRPAIRRAEQEADST